METIKVEMTMEFYKSLTPDQRVSLMVISLKTLDFEDDEEWLQLKKDCARAYRKLYKREFELRSYLKEK